MSRVFAADRNGVAAPLGKRGASSAGPRAVAFGHRVHLLLVDDDPLIHEFVAGALGERKFRLSSATSVAEALALLHGEIPDLVVTALRLGDVEGWKLVEVLRSDATYRRVLVVILTTSDETADRQRSLTMGADRYLLKPVSADQLRRTIRELTSTRDDLWLAMSLGAGESHRVRELLYDPTAKAQTLASAIDSLRPEVERGEMISVWWIVFNPLFEVKGILWSRLDEFRQRMARGIEILLPPILGGEVTLSVTHPGANEFQCFVRAGDEDSVCARLAEVEQAVRSLAEATRGEVGLVEQLTVFVSCATTSVQPLYAPRLLYEAVRASREGADLQQAQWYRRLGRVLTQTIRKKRITTRLQPLFELESGQLYGYEASAGGPPGTEIERPAHLFDLARRMDLTWELELLCIDDVSAYLDEICGRGKLFFRLEASFIRQLHARGVAPLEPLLRHRRSIVIVVEEAAARDLSLVHDTLKDLKRMGFAIALQSGGQAGLELLAELAPDYLKIGPALLREAPAGGVHRRLLESFVRMAGDVGARTIADTIETEGQRAICSALAISLGQGYLFGRPRTWAEIRATKDVAIAPPREPAGGSGEGRPA